MDNNVKSYRKPYVRPVKANWWTDRSFYIMYMLREGTSIFGLIVALELLYLICAPIFSLPTKFIANPVMAIINIVALVSVMYHTFTWFNLMPLVLRIFKSNQPTETKLIPAKLFVIGLWAAWVVACIVLALVFIFVNIK
ncbi:MAG: fumarate reductase subunit C [Ruminobacter sp.]|nr:fumarate reductase subunit C [Ruminobacter sp.]MDY5779262.1 fumarate reductase subunit C [Succinivibrionaceae bacterium]